MLARLLGFYRLHTCNRGGDSKFTTQGMLFVGGGRGGGGRGVPGAIFTTQGMLFVEGGVTK